MFLDMKSPSNPGCSLVAGRQPGLSLGHRLGWWHSPCKKKISMYSCQYSTAILSSVCVIFGRVGEGRYWKPNPGRRGKAAQWCSAAAAIAYHLVIRRFVCLLSHLKALFRHRCFIKSLQYQQNKKRNNRHRLFNFHLSIMRFSFLFTIKRI